MTISKTQFEAAELLDEALNGSGQTRDRAVRLIQEKISTSDLPVQLSPAMTRILMNRYQEIPSTWTEYAARMTVDNFESNEHYTFEFGDEDIPSKKDGRAFHSGGLAPIGELGEYPVIRFTASGIQLRTQKSGVKIGISWEAIQRSGNVQIIRRALTEFGERAKRSENFAAAGQLVNADGISANFTNRLDKNPVLSLESLEAGLAQIATSKDAKGRRIVVPTSFNLVVPSTVAPLAQSLMAIREIRRTTAGGDEYTMSNPVAGKIAKVVEVPELHVLGDGAADNAWFLLPTVGSGAQDSVVNVFLSGHETPRVFVKRDTNSSPEDGSFDDDSYETKVRHFVQGGFISDVATIASDGSGSN